MYDIILAGGTVYDGTGSKPVLANVCIQGGKIAKITQDLPQAKEVLDVTGLAVTPGFIDTHTHSDSSHFGAAPALSQVAQGVTTEIAGNCGGSMMPTTPERLPK